MYNDGVITNEFTGYYDGVAGEYIYPAAPQNFIIVFDNFYLSSDDGDFDASGITITTETGQAEDITIGNAPSAVLSATMLNPSGLMESLTWGWGKTYIGVVTASTGIDLSASPTKTYAKKGTTIYRMTATTAYAGSASASISGQPMSIIVESDGKAWFYTDTNAYYYNGNTIATATPTDFNAAKGRYKDGKGILLDANSLPITKWTITDADGKAATEETYTYVPMGVFDFSNIDAFGITFGVEAYDKMTLLDADATAWAAAIDYTIPKTLSQLVTAIGSQLGITTTISASAVNTSLSWSVNPITSYSVTYRQLIKWLAEAMGCNARMTRTGDLELYTYGPTTTPVASITADTIVSNTRIRARYTVPQITMVYCYTTVGASYTSGSAGSNYYLVGNPFIDPSDTPGITPLTDLGTLLHTIPAYYPVTICVACADPRIDAGDYISVGTTDGTSPFTIPVMHRSLTWNGTCSTRISANGNQVRTIPSSMENTDLSSMVDSNPSSVINKIQAVGIDADWITAGKISDRQHKNYWNLETGDFVITDGIITATYTETIDHSEYSQEDLDILDDLSSPTSDPLTPEQKLKYDIDGSGLIDEDDYNRIEWMITNGQDITRTITTTIDPRTSDKAIRITTSVPATGSVPAHVIESYYSGAKTQSSTVYCDRVVFSGDTHATMIANEYDEEVSIGQPSIRPWGHSEDDVSVPNDSWKTVNDVDLPPGMWYITAVARFTQSATGRRMVCISTDKDTTPNGHPGTPVDPGLIASVAACSGSRTSAMCCGPLYLSQATHLYMNCYQNSGGSKGTLISLKIVRLV